MKQATSDEARRVMDTFRRAAEVNRATPARGGNVVALTADNAADCLISADLHGNVANFGAILRRAALDDFPRRHLVLQEVCHGGPAYANGGCMSHLMLQRIAELKAQYPDRIHFLLSNHELAELTDYPILKGKRLLNLAFRLGLETCYGDDADEVREAYCEFLRSCPLAVRINGVFVSHSLPPATDCAPFDASILSRPYADDDLGEGGAVFNLVWGRDFRRANAAAFAREVEATVLVHGHEPCREGYAVPNPLQLILDCCSSPACCAVLPTGRELSHADVVAAVEQLAKGS